MKIIKDFLKNLVSYFKYIMKLNFKDLFVKFIEFIMLVILSLIVFIPIQFVRDTLLSVINVTNSLSSVVINIYNLFFYVISIISCIFVFIYLFNMRYEELGKEKVIENDVNVKMNTDSERDIQKIVDDIKIKDENDKKTD